MNISLPDAQKEFVDDVVKEGQFNSASEYIRKLIREDYERREKEENEWILKKVAEAAGDKYHKYTPALMEEIYQRALAAHKKKQKGASTRDRT